ncbi:MAG: hypothetical protein IPH97_06205 [Ignavibacteriales bacterium]|nr:hypothetical protein [Ignavibacteriales bacterium]
MPRNFSFHHPITASMHYNRAIICFQNAFNVPDGSFIFYAALELRICIERFLFEYLVIMNTDESKIEKYMKEYRIKSLSNAIYEAEPEFDKKLEYTNFYLHCIGSNFQIKVPNTNVLNNYYGKLGNYLHNLKRPADTIQKPEWWDEFINLLQETRAYLFEFIGVPRAFFKMNEKGLELYQAYKDESLIKEEIQKRILEGI